MNPSIKPTTALLLFAVFFAVLAGKFWAHGAAGGVRLFSHMHSHPDGDLYIMLGNRLFGIDRQGRDTGQIDLARFGIDEAAATDFAFFGNGDLLIRPRLEAQGFIHDLQQYFRFKNQEPAFAGDGAEGLFRCELKQYQCRAFGEPPLHLTDAFWLDIDWQGDQVFVADTSRHSVYLFSGKGEKLDAADRFLFPNQIQYQDGKLHVADTNHHLLETLEIKAGRFGETLDSLYTPQGPALADLDLWPETFAIAEGRRWVHNAKQDMAHGGIYGFDSAGKFLKRADLPPDADPFALARLGQAILVGDYSQGRIYQIDAEGNRLPDFQSPAMQTSLERLAQRKSFYHRLEMLFTALFGLGLAGGFGVAVYQQRKAAGPAGSPPPVASGVDDSPVHWIKPRLRFKLAALVISLLSPLLLGMAWLAYYIKGFTLGEFAKQNYTLIALGIWLSLSMLLQLRRKIGLAGNAMVIVPAMGKTLRCAPEEISYSGIYVLFGSKVLTSAQLAKMFPEEEVEQRIYPLIKRGRPVEIPEIQAVLWRKKSAFVLRLVIITALVGAFLYFGFASL